MRSLAELGTVRKFTGSTSDHPVYLISSRDPSSMSCADLFDENLRLCGDLIEAALSHDDDKIIAALNNREGLVRYAMDHMGGIK